MADTPIDAAYQEHEALVQMLDVAKEISLKSVADDRFRRVLVIAAGSYFESRVRGAIESFVALHSQNHAWVMAFLRAKALERQYHSYFEWKGSNANSFFGLFGEDCLKRHSSAIKDNEELRAGMRSFLELGRLRNELAHKNFLTYPIEKTVEEVYAEFLRSLVFVEYVEQVFS